MLFNVYPLIINLYTNYYSLTVLFLTRCCTKVQIVIINTKLKMYCAASAIIGQTWVFVEE
jgi:hypothetical protein